LHTQAKNVFAAFEAAGVKVRSIALMLDAHPTTLYKWVKPVGAGYVPRSWWPDLLRIAEQYGIRDKVAGLLVEERPRNPRRRRKASAEDIFA
jgi:hypothetical protein